MSNKKSYLNNHNPDEDYPNGGNVVLDMLYLPTMVVKIIGPLGGFQNSSPVPVGMWLGMHDNC